MSGGISALYDIDFPCHFVQEFPDLCMHLYHCKGRVLELKFRKIKRFLITLKYVCHCLLSVVFFISLYDTFV